MASETALTTVMGDATATTDQPDPTTTTQPLAERVDLTFDIGDAVSDQHEHFARDAVTDAIETMAELTGYAVSQLRVIIHADGPTGRRADGGGGAVPVRRRFRLLPISRAVAHPGCRTG